MKPRTLVVVVLTSATIFISCSNEDSVTLTETAPITETSPNSAVVTYNQNVKSIIDNNCIVCHAAVPRNGARNALVTFAQVREAMMNRGLLNRISLPNGNGLLMPQGGPRMPQATIDLVSKWQQDGLLENN